MVTVPARFAAPARKPTLHLPAHWPWPSGWKTLWDNIIGCVPRSHEQDERHVPRPPAIPARPDPGDTWKAGAGQRITHAHTIPNRPNRAEISPATAPNR